MILRLPRGRVARRANRARRPEALSGANRAHPLLSSGAISRWQACGRRDGAAPKAVFRYARARARYLSLFPSLSRALCRHDVGAPSAPPRGRIVNRHGSSSMFARESDAVSPRLGRCTILVCAAGTSRVTRRASREFERPFDVVAIGARSCASASQWCVGQSRLVCLSVAWRHRSSRSSSSNNSNSSGNSSSSSSISGGGGGGNNLKSEQLLQGVRVRGPCGSRSRLRRELARRSARRCVSAVTTATAAAATAARAARTR